MESLNHISFGARMDLSGIKKNENRWNNVAKTFEQKTADYPLDVFRLQEHEEGLSAYGFNKDTQEEIMVELSNENVADLMKMTDKSIASKFKKLLEISEQKGNVYKATNEFLEKLNSIYKNDNDDGFEEKIWDIVVDTAEKNADIAKEKDSFLRELDIRF